MFHIYLYWPLRGGGRYSDNFIHTSARAIFGGSKFELQYFLVFFFSENEYFFGYEDFVGGGGGAGVNTKLDYISGSFLCILGSFLKVKVQIVGILGGC